jgi:hypothetical protein
MQKSPQYTVFGDLDGITVAELKSLLSKYPDHAVISAHSDLVYGFRGWTGESREYFVVQWEQ